MPQKLINTKGTITKEYLYEEMHKEELPNMQTTLQILNNSYTYLKIPKDHVYTWVQGIYQLLLFSQDQPRHHL